ncbi:hypothetical protein ACVXHB_07675 [Escherichia coli]
MDDDGKSFWVLRMKVRDRIVADGIDDPHFDASNVGEYLQAAEVNAMLDDPDALFIDMRNHYGMKWGTLKTRSKFRQIPSVSSCQKQSR